MQQLQILGSFVPVCYHSKECWAGIKAAKTHCSNDAAKQTILLSSYFEVHYCLESCSRYLNSTKEPDIVIL